MIAPPTQRTFTSQASVDKIAIRMNATTRVISPATANPYSTFAFPVTNRSTQPLFDLTIAIAMTVNRLGNGLGSRNVHGWFSVIYGAI